MKRRSLAAAGLLTLVFGVTAAPALAQQGCQTPAALPQASGANIFSVQQEMDLGDAVAEQLQHQFRVIDDPEATGYLAAVANRMAAQLPGHHPNLRLFLVDLPALNAFSLAGGRIYVTRKMVAFLRSDDELAGMLGHEMGHILSGQFGVTMTAWFRGVLGVTQVGDRKDIFDKYNQFLDNIGRHPDVLRKERDKEEPKQYQADQIGLIAMSNAGYAPQAFVDLFDRLAGTHGKTGNWFSDLFGAPPEQKRLRVMHRALDDLPAGCVRRKETAASKEFLDWQSSVAGYSGLNRHEALPNVAVKIGLDPPLRTDIKQLKYSPDGRYILAQDDTSICLLSREPFQTVFRIPVDDAEPAQFTPDSESLVFHTRALQVEKWSIAEEKQMSRKELFIRQGCRDSALSPDGKTLACYGVDHELALYDVDSGSSYFTHKFTPDFLDYPGFLSELLRLIGFKSLHIRFSPDGRYIVAAKHADTVAVDLSTRAPVHLHGTLSQGLRGAFDFLGPDRIVRQNLENLRESDVLSFPAGQKISTVVLLGTRLDAATHGHTVVIGPVKDAAAALVDVDTQKVWVALKKFSAVDIYDQTYVHEQYNGGVGEYELTSGKLRRTAPLPPTLLGRMQTAVASPDLRWLALSGTTRGAVWDLSTGARRYHLRGFRGGYFDGDRGFYAEYAKLDEQARSIARADLASTDVSLASPVGEDDATDYAGRFWLTWKPPGRKKGDVAASKIPVLEVRDVIGGKPIWSRQFPEGGPRMFAYGLPVSLVFEWKLKDEAAREAAKKDEDLRAQIAKIDKPEGSYLLEIVDLANGKPRGYLPVDTGKGSFRLRYVYSTGDYVVATDSLNRVHLYSLSRKEQLRTFFGSNSAISERGGLLCVENEPGQISLYDLKTWEKRESYTFGYPTAFGQFSEDGRRLLVVTQNQKAYVLNVSGHLATQ